jgi:hypothetical protein
MNLSIIVLFSGYIYQITLYIVYRIDKIDIYTKLRYTLYMKFFERHTLS